MMILGGNGCPEPSEPSEPPPWGNPKKPLVFIAPAKCRKRWDAHRKFGLQVRFQTSDGLEIIRALVPWNMAVPWRSMAPHPAGPFLQRFNALLQANSGPKFHDSQRPVSLRSDHLGHLQRPARSRPWEPWQWEPHPSKRW